MVLKILSLNIFYAPSLHHNLLSRSQLLEKGYNMHIHHDYCTLIDKNESYMPKSNEFIIRKNITLMDMVRCMLKAKQMPKEFLAEAVAIIVYILNKCLTKSVCDKMLEEALSGRKLSIRHLKAFD
ncbi:hypothetical protein CR513_59514, partial [Mucuna pruriens]